MRKITVEQWITDGTRRLRVVTTSSRGTSDQGHNAYASAISAFGSEVDLDGQPDEVAERIGAQLQKRMPPELGVVAQVWVEVGGRGGMWEPEEEKT